MRTIVCRGKEPDGSRCPNPTSDPSRRCPRHRDFGARFRPSSRRPRVYDSPAWRRLRAEVIADWVARHGWVCPGWRVPAHPARRLVVDHVTPLIAGGAGLDRANLRALCVACNSRKALRDRKAR